MRERGVALVRANRTALAARAGGMAAALERGEAERDFEEGALRSAPTLASGLGHAPVPLALALALALPLLLLLALPLTLTLTLPQRRRERSGRRGHHPQGKPRREP